MRNTTVPRSQRRGLRGCTALASAATLTAITAALATASPPAQAGITHRPDAITPDTTSSNTVLRGVSAVSATDAWAVGQYLNSSGNAYEPLVLHWNGTAWKTVTSPAPSGASLEGVSAVSATDAWAAGYTNPSSAPDEPLLLHWNGTAWKVVTSPDPSGAKNAFLYGVSADSATDAWAAGYYSNSSGVDEPLLLHWNGTAWKQLKSPVPSGAQSPPTLSGVSAVSATDAWAFGSYGTSSVPDEPLLLHWNGTAWKVATGPVRSSAQTTTDLDGVSADSATDAWAVGSSTKNSTGATETLALHWNGTAWKQVTSPAHSGTDYTNLDGVSAVSATDAWAVGDWYDIGTGEDVQLILHWNGTTWKQVTSPAPSGAVQTSLDAVSAVSATDAWAAGAYSSSGVRETLILHWNGTGWKVVKSPNGT